jgi:hypothetical protein
MRDSLGRPLGSSLRELARLRTGRRRRFSSWDRTGGNDDCLRLAPGQTAVLAEPGGAGCVTHLWMTAGCPEEHYLRKLVLRMFWDGEANPSVEVPLGDFFGVGHGLTRNFASLPLTMSPQDGRGFNCFFPMPFADGARIEVTNECERATARFYYYVDYEAYDALEEGLGRFHAQWRRENPTDGIPDTGISNVEYQFGRPDYRTVPASELRDGQYGRVNPTGAGNYVILEAQGKGHYVGCNLNIHNLRHTDRMNWFGEGDDMIFVDGESFPPSLHGTGTEDYFNTAWCPQQEFSAPYHGITLGGGTNWAGKASFYRFHIEDPVMFERSIRVTLEHGHNNHRSDDYSSTAYWYQTEPHKPFRLSPVSERLPRPDEARTD